MTPEKSSVLEYADPFHGNGEVATPAPRGIAAAWNWRKAQVGNTHPGATRPFGMVSVCPYSGAYPTGYGLYDLTTNGPAKRLYDRQSCKGLTHFHSSGIGNAEFFYNYLRVEPLHQFAQRGRRWTLTEETAYPGYYTAVLRESGVKVELTAGRKSAIHRYVYPSGSPAVLVVDLTAGGLELPGYPQYRTVPETIRARWVSQRVAIGGLVSRGFPLYFCLLWERPPSQRGVWKGRRTSGDETAIAADGPANAGEGAGLYAGYDRVTAPLLLTIGFSFRCAEQARANAEAGSAWTFAQSVEAAARDWQEHLQRIQVEGHDESRKRVFYSCLYHSLIKPADCSNESPFWSGNTPYFVDFVTMWDMYKTQLPLVLTVYPQRGAGIVRSMMKVMQVDGCFPNGYMMEKGSDRFEDQGSGLAWHTFADAWFRGIEGIPWQDMVALIPSLTESKRARQFINIGKAFPYSHTIDLVCAFAAAARIAAGTDHRQLAEELLAHTGKWRNVYDPRTGLLDERCEYYEGTHWNYSFRPHPHMADRIALFADHNAFVEALDTFFGYQDIATGIVNPDPDPDRFVRRIRKDRFEGLNNETDMESPFAYLWVGRHDRTAEIVRAVMEFQFSTGRGGLPGNDDSGALSSWCVWNAIGLFPVAGRDMFLIGSPVFGRAEIAVPGGTLSIQAVDNSKQNLYVQGAKLNGEVLNRANLTVREVIAGGKLEIFMGPRPSGWAGRNPPPD